MDIKKPNPLTVQSKKWLLDALLALMHEKKYEKITIKELAGRSGLDRKTFYRHFKTKDELLGLFLEEACAQYIILLKNLPAINKYEITKAYFTLCLQYVDILKIFYEQGLLMMILMKCDDFFPNINEVFENNLMYRKKTEYEMCYHAGGKWNVTMRWICNGAKETPEEMAKVISLICV